MKVNRHDSRSTNKKNTTAKQSVQENQNTTKSMACRNGNPMRSGLEVVGTKRGDVGEKKKSKQCIHEISPCERKTR